MSDVKAVEGAKKKTKRQSYNGQPIRLYVKGVHLGYRRSKVDQYPTCSLVKIEGVNSKKDSEFYMGKRIAYIYKAKTIKNGTRYRVIWGKIRRSHGTNGVVRCSFKSNLPPASFGAALRVMLYPSRI